MVGEYVRGSVHGTVCLLGTEGGWMHAWCVCVRVEKLHCFGRGSELVSRCMRLRAQNHLRMRHECG